MEPAFATSPAQDLELLRTTAVAAGILASGYFRRNLATWTKDNLSPVTEADIVVDKFLAASLLAARPDYGWLSEETVDTPERLGRKRCFVVDPIDGTRGFIKGEETWTVCLAVVEYNQPIAGVVYAPARDEMFEAVIGHGASLNGKLLSPRRRSDPRPLIPAPGAVHQELQRAGLDYTRGPHFPSLAYRLAQVATGSLDATVARRGSSDWDIAAAAIILWEAGVDFEDVCMGRMQFNRPETRHGALAAVADMRLKPLLHEALVSVYGCPDAASETDLRERTSS